MKQTLPLKYRPKYLRDIIGQDVLVQTLKNSIKYDRIANAFLLTGSHGIGKTSTARIIAALLNCLNRADCEPCGKCRSCIEIFTSSHPDIMEIDAASNTGVDNIRTIIDNTSYLPNYASYRIYIIDEVHMLSISAFNALLKTLEEPPKNIIFILATTDLKKVPKTIVSRCQRFHLKRMRDDILTNHLKNICKKEEIIIEDDGLSLIIQS
ncbi:MAG: DNA polymerase III subunit gamma/tau, partial [Anaplasmataceae bacterium]|nr:DNA polymerase III subunit gamma/tau [Anaplasmataceae bacterium]